MIVFIIIIVIILPAEPGILKLEKEEEQEEEMELWSREEKGVERECNNIPPILPFKTKSIRLSVKR